MLRTRQSRLKVFSTLLQVDAIGRNPLSNVKETPESLHLEVSSPPSCSQLSEASCSLPAIKRGEIVDPVQLGIRLESSRGTISKQYSVRMLPDAARERSAAAKQEMRRDHLAAIKHFQLRAVAGSNAASDAQPPSSLPASASGDAATAAIGEQRGARRPAGAMSGDPGVQGAANSPQFGANEAHDSPIPKSSPQASLPRDRREATRPPPTKLLAVGTDRHLALPATAPGRASRDPGAFEMADAYQALNREGGTTGGSTKDWTIPAVVPRARPVSHRVRETALEGLQQFAEDRLRRLDCMLDTLDDLRRVPSGTLGALSAGGSLTERKAGQGSTTADLVAPGPRQTSVPISQRGSAEALAMIASRGAAVWERRPPRGHGGIPPVPILPAAASEKGEGPAHLPRTAEALRHFAMRRGSQAVASAPTSPVLQSQDAAGAGRSVRGDLLRRSLPGQALDGAENTLQSLTRLLTEARRAGQTLGYSQGFSKGFSSVTAACREAPRFGPPTPASTTNIAAGTLSEPSWSPRRTDSGCQRDPAQPSDRSGSPGSPQSRSPLRDITSAADRLLNPWDSSQPARIGPEPGNEACLLASTPPTPSFMEDPNHISWMLPGDGASSPTGLAKPQVQSPASSEGGPERGLQSRSLIPRHDGACLNAPRFSGEAEQQEAKQAAVQMVSACTPPGQSLKVDADAANASPCRAGPVHFPAEGPVVRCLWEDALPHKEPAAATDPQGPSAIFKDARGLMNQQAGASPVCPIVPPDPTTPPFHHATRSDPAKVVPGNMPAGCEAGPHQEAACPVPDAGSDSRAEVAGHHTAAVGSRLSRAGNRVSIGQFRSMTASWSRRQQPSLAASTDAEQQRATCGALGSAQLPPDGPELSQVGGDVRAAEAAQPNALDTGCTNNPQRVNAAQILAGGILLPTLDMRELGGVCTTVGDEVSGPDPLHASASENGIGVRPRAGRDSHIKPWLPDRADSSPDFRQQSVGPMVQKVAICEAAGGRGEDLPAARASLSVLGLLADLSRTDSSTRNVVTEDNLVEGRAGENARSGVRAQLADVQMQRLPPKAARKRREREAVAAREVGRLVAQIDSMMLTPRCQMSTAQLQQYLDLKIQLARARVQSTVAATNCTSARLPVAMPITRIPVLPASRPLHTSQAVNAGGIASEHTTGRSSAPPTPVPSPSRIPLSHNSFMSSQGTMPLAGRVSAGCDPAWSLRKPREFVLQEAVGGRGAAHSPKQWIRVSERALSNSITNRQQAGMWDPSASLERPCPSYMRPTIVTLMHHAKSVSP